MRLGLQIKKFIKYYIQFRDIHTHDIPLKRRKSINCWFKTAQESIKLADMLAREKLQVSNLKICYDFLIETSIVFVLMS